MTLRMDFIDIIEPTARAMFHDGQSYFDISKTVKKVAEGRLTTKDARKLLDLIIKRIVDETIEYRNKHHS